MESRIEALKRMLQARPDDPRALFGLALEHERAGRWQEAADTLRTYLARADDEGNAYARLARALRELGQDEDAREIYRQGIEVAYRHGHPSMAMEMEEALEEL